MGWAIIDETENGITMETIVYHYAYNKRLIRDMEEEIALTPINVAVTTTHLIR